MGVIVPSYPLQLDPNTTQGLVWAPDMSGPRRTFSGDTGDVADLCGNTAAMTRTGSCKGVKTPFGPGLSFDGSTAIASANTALSFTDFTMFALVNQANASQITSQRVISFQPGPTYAAYVGLVINNGHVTALSSLDSIVYPANGSTISINTFHLIACVRNTGAGLFSVYIDGLLDWSQAITSKSAYSLSGTLTLGGAATAGFGEFFNGSVAGAGIFRRSMLGPETAALAANPNRIFRQRRNCASMLKSPSWNFADPAMSSYSDMGF